MPETTHKSPSAAAHGSECRPPKHIWADCDPKAPRKIRWAFYRTLAEQRGNRPDLHPIKLSISQ